MIARKPSAESASCPYLPPSGAPRRSAGLAFPDFPFSIAVSHYQPPNPPVRVSPGAGAVSTWAELLCYPRGMMSEIKKIKKVVRATDVGRKRALIVKKCARCGTRFLVKHSRQKFCSNLCLERAKAMRKKALLDRQKGERVDRKS